VIPDGDSIIRIVAAVAIDGRGEILLVRKCGTSAFMLPGGKPGPGESALDALVREIGEERDCGVDRAACRSLGTFRAAAANEPGFTVEAELFAVSLVGDPRPSGEIDEMRWLDPGSEPPFPMAQLAREHALPQARLLIANARSLSK